MKTNKTEICKCGHSKRMHEGNYCTKCYCELFMPQNQSQEKQKGKSRVNPKSNLPVTQLTDKSGIETPDTQTPPTKPLKDISRYKDGESNYKDKTAENSNLSSKVQLQYIETGDITQGIYTREDVKECFHRILDEVDEIVKRLKSIKPKDNQEYEKIALQILLLDELIEIILRNAGEDLI